MKNVCYFLFLLLNCILFMSACVPKYLPVPTKSVEISGEFGIITLGNTTLATTEAIWGREPQYLPDYYLTLYVRIKNGGVESLPINPIDFAIIDENDIQFDIINYDVVLELMLQHPSLIPERFTIANEGIRDNLARRNEIRMNIINNAFTFGEIHKGSIKEGILYFPKLSNNNKEFTLVYKDNEIKFKKTK